MIVIENNQVDEIPVLHVVQKEIQRERLPLVIFLHGFTSIKERNLHYAYLLAAKGFRVVLPEANFHGEREIKRPNSQLDHHFWEIVIQSIHELPKIKDYYQAETLVDFERIGVVGTSMGGITTLGALTQYDWIKAAVSLMGVPSYQQLARHQLNDLTRQQRLLSLSEIEVERALAQLAPYDLSLQPEKIDDRPLLFWHGKKDPVVPYNLAYDFYEKIKPREKKRGQLQFITDKEAEHQVSLTGVDKTIEWFENHLS